MHTKSIHLLSLSFSLALLLAARAQSEAAQPVQLDGLEAWRAPLGDWYEAATVKLHPDHHDRLQGQPGEGILVNGGSGKTKHLVSREEHGDVQLDLEFLVSKGSNSGVYLMGRYEIQILDSWGVEKPAHSDVGGIYQRYNEDPQVPEAERGYEGRPPRVNASKAPGEWQKFEITFRAPRFDAAGKKTEDARFLKVILNGESVQENEPLSGPTRSAMYKDEKPLGPLMIQGDHGPVAIRNVRMRALQ